MYLLLGNSTSHGCQGWIGAWHHSTVVFYPLGVVHQPRPMAVILQHTELHPNSYCTSCIPSIRIAGKTLAQMHAHIRAHINWCILCLDASKSQSICPSVIWQSFVILSHLLHPRCPKRTAWQSGILSLLSLDPLPSLSPSGAGLCRSKYDHWLSLYPTSELRDDPWQSSCKVNCACALWRHYYCPN